MVLREDRELLAHLAQVNSDVPEFAMRLMSGALPVREQRAFALRLVDVAETLMAHADRRDNNTEGDPAAPHSRPGDRRVLEGRSASPRHGTRHERGVVGGGLVTASHDDPLASASSRFALCGPLDAPPAEDAPSPTGVRPWGLRNLTVAPVSAPSQVTARFDHERQMVVDSAGRPLVTRGPPTANTTSRVDGEDPPSSEDWRNDYWPDAPAEDPVATAAPAAGSADGVAGGRG